MFEVSGFATSGYGFRTSESRENTVSKKRQSSDDAHGPHVSTGWDSATGFGRVGGGNKIYRNNGFLGELRWGMEEARNRKISEIVLWKRRDGFVKVVAGSTAML